MTAPDLSRTNWRPYLPHGDGFLFIDEVVSLSTTSDGAPMITTRYRVPAVYQQDHFGIFPGVLAQEMANQSLIVLYGLAGWLSDGIVPVLASTAWSFRRPILVGQTITCQITCDEASPDWRRGVTAEATLFVHPGTKQKEVANGQILGKGLSPQMYQRFMAHACL